MWVNYDARVLATGIGQQESESLDMKQYLGIEKKTGIKPGIIALVKKRRLIDNTKIRD